MIYKGLRFKVDYGRDIDVYTISSVGPTVSIVWDNDGAGYPLDEVEYFFRQGMWVPIHQTSDFLKTLKKCINEENHL